jgi:peptidyl-tRNA hydrolase, PTH1 family
MLLADSRMKLIVGLGNPGRKYEQTRHNVGFEVLDRLAGRFGDGPAKEKFDGLLAEAAIEGQRALLLWPQTLMNRSGRSVAQAVGFYKLELADLLVVCDDFNLPQGTLRFRGRGSAGGQNGLDDVIGQLGTEDFSRLRVGIGPLPDQWDPADFVLGRFGAQEREVVDEAIARAAQGVECWVTDGVEECMSRFN